MSLDHANPVVEAFEDIKAAEEGLKNANAILIEAAKAVTREAYERIFQGREFPMYPEVSRLVPDIHGHFLLIIESSSGETEWSQVPKKTDDETGIAFRPFTTNGGWKALEARIPEQLLIQHGKEMQKGT